MASATVKSSIGVLTIAQFICSFVSHPYWFLHCIGFRSSESSFDNNNYIGFARNEAITIPYF